MNEQRVSKLNSYFEEQIDICRKRNKELLIFLIGNFLLVLKPKFTSIELDFDFKFKWADFYKIFC